MATSSVLLRSLIKRHGGGGGGGGDVASSSSSLFALTRSLACKPGTAWATFASSKKLVKTPLDEKSKSRYPTSDEEELEDLVKSPPDFKPVWFDNPPLAKGWESFYPAAERIPKQDLKKIKTVEDLFIHGTPWDQEEWVELGASQNPVDYD